MNKPIKDDSYQISIQNIEYYSHHIRLGIEILLIIRGEIEVTVNQSSFQLAENDLLLINANDIRSIKGNKENVVLSLQVPLDLIEQHYPNIHECYFNCNSSKEGNGLYLLFDQIRQLMAKILIAYYQKQDGSEIEINGLIFQLVTLLIRNFKTTHLGSHQFTEMKDERIRELLAFIERNYRKPISLEEIAKQQYLSLYYLSRYFKQEVGVSFSQYVKNVRLKSAVHELLYTDHNILRISLNNGFPNVKAFNKAFKEMYQQTPTEYRSLHKVEPMDVEEMNHETEQYTLLQSPNFLMEISKYISGNEKSTTLMEPAASAVYVELPHEPIFIKEKSLKVLVIGQLEYALHEEVQADLKLIQEELGFDYIYFTNLFSDSFAMTTPLYQIGGQFYQMDALFTRFQQLGLVPFIRVEVEKEVERSSEYLKKLDEFLQHSLSYFGGAFVGKWRFELVFSAWDETGKSFYQDFYQTVKKWASAAKVGLHVPFSLGKAIPGPADDFLKQISDRCDLVCFTCNPNEEVDFTDMDNLTFEGVKNYVKKACSRLKECLSPAGLEEIPIFLTDWNTLYGNTMDLSGTFFRSALIFKEMLDAMKEITGLGFWIDTHSLEKNNLDQDHIAMNGIALLYYYQIKRPAYFNFQLMKKIDLRILAEGEDFVMTKGESGYQLVVYNPSYINPSYSVESFFLQSITKEKKVVISGLPPGRYQIRKHILDQNNGEFYINWINLQHQDIYDQEVISFIKQGTRPDLQIYEEKVEAELYLQSILTFNAFHLFEIKPLS
ncbi:helix-turn-helix domain-containing protein [Neobacillus drentensis]|uniref:helix-turn-helix domain-containing protein n=1 Tax=Neobacillus drentensis TaxID=220684 RepID=UPI001F3C2D2C|nr:helix-turn-helix domain-containing protein [Neobacillus drentensis]ULT57871.1 helix-turn-helix domain-containing protein [Neobacillus drentensis]